MCADVMMIMAFCCVVHTVCMYVINTVSIHIQHCVNMLNTVPPGQVHRG